MSDRACPGSVRGQACRGAHSHRSAQHRRAAVGRRLAVHNRLPANDVLARHARAAAAAVLSGADAQLSAQASHCSYTTGSVLDPDPQFLGQIRSAGRISSKCLELAATQRGARCAAPGGPRERASLTFAAARTARTPAGSNDTTSSLESVSSPPPTPIVASLQISQHRNPTRDVRRRPAGMIGTESANCRRSLYALPTTRSRASGFLGNRSHRFSARRRSTIAR